MESILLAWLLSGDVTLQDPVRESFEVLYEGKRRKGTIYIMGQDHNEVDQTKEEDKLVAISHYNILRDLCLLGITTVFSESAQEDITQEKIVNSEGLNKDVFISMKEDAFPGGCANAKNWDELNENALILTGTLGAHVLYATLNEKATIYSTTPPDNEELIKKIEWYFEQEIFPLHLIADYREEVALQKINSIIKPRQEVVLIYGYAHYFSDNAPQYGHSILSKSYGENPMPRLSSKEVSDLIQKIEEDANSFEYTEIEENLLTLNMTARDNIYAFEDFLTFRNEVYITLANKAQEKSREDPTNPQYTALEKEFTTKVIEITALPK